MISTRVRGDRIWLAALAAITLLLSLFLTVITPVQTASAGTDCGLCTGVGTGGDNGTPPPSGGGGGTHPPAGGGGGTGSGGGGYNGGTGNNGTWTNWSQANTYFFPSGPPAVLRAPGANPTGVVVSYNNKCGGSSAWGKYLGVRTAQSGRQLTDNSGGSGNGGGTGNGVTVSEQTSASYTCIDPPHYTDSTRTCAGTVGAKATGPYKNQDGIAVKTFYTSGPANSPFAASGYTDLSKCGTAFTQNFNAGLSWLGQYKLTATGTQVTVTIRHYTTSNAQTGARPADKVVGRSMPFPYRVNQVKAQVWCSGWSPDWSGNHSFTQDECQQSKIWTCGPGVTKAPTYNGVTVPAKGIGVLGDGKKRAATWTSPVLTGALKNSRAKSVKLQLDTKSAPYRTGQSVNGPTQPYVIDPLLNSWVTGWGKTWNVGFQQASLPGKLWTATPAWAFTADFRTTTISSIKVNWNTGAITVTTTIKYVTGTALCTGKPVNISVSRARNTR